MTQIAQKIVVELEDGSYKMFDTKAEAVDFLRRPQQMKALRAFIDQDELASWIVDVQDELADAFEAAKVKRVTKQEKKELEKALEALAAAEAGNKAYKFIIDNAKVIADSFRWPSVKRGDEAEQKAQIVAAVAAVAGGDEELANWLVESKDQILEALEAGKVKREMNPKAMEGLARHRAELAAKKAAEEAAKAE